MARKMILVAAPRAGDSTLVIRVDPLAAARGHRALPRGGVHGSAKRPGRAQAKRTWRRQLDRDGAPRWPH